MNPYKAQAHIYSLDGATDEITVLEKVEREQQDYYIVDYRGIKCTAIFNWFNGSFYADDIYGRIKE